jgi:penicillin-binding protein 1A
MRGLFYGANVDGGTFPAAIWGAYMREAAGSYCGDFRAPGRSAGVSPAS